MTHIYTEERQEVEKELSERSAAKLPSPCPCVLAQTVVRLNCCWGDLEYYCKLNRSTMYISCKL